MRSRDSIVRLALIVGGLALPLSAAFAQSPEEVAKQLADLTKRVEVLERQAAAAKAAAPPVARQRAEPAGREEAVKLYEKVDGLVAAGNLEQAQAELAAWDQKYAGTNSAGWTGGLGRELAVVGKAAPADWAIEKWYQGESEIKLDGKVPTLIVFWESWCPHCRDEVPKLQKVFDDYKGKGLQVIGVTRLTQTATEESAKTFIAEQKVSYPIAKETGALAEYFNVKGIPAAAIVKDGKIVWRGHPMRITDELLHHWL